MSNKVSDVAARRRTDCQALVVCTKVVIPPLRGNTHMSICWTPSTYPLWWRVWRPAHTVKSSVDFSLMRSNIAKSPYSILTNAVNRSWSWLTMFEGRWRHSNAIDGVQVSSMSASVTMLLKSSNGRILRPSPAFAHMQKPSVTYKRRWHLNAFDGFQGRSNRRTRA